MSLAAISQIVGVAAPLVAGKKISDILDDLKSTLAEITVLLENAVNNIAEDLASQLEVTVAEITEEVNDVLEEHIETVDDKVKRQIYVAVVSAKNLKDELANDIVEISAEFNRDFRQTLAKVSFIGEIYALDTVDNTLVPYTHKGDWTVIARGVGVGFDSEDVKSTATLIVDSEGSEPLEIPGLEVSDTEVNFTIPSEIISSERDKYELNKIKCILKFEITEDRVLFFDKKFEISQPIYISVAPDFMADVNATSVSPIYKWKPRPNLNRTLSKSLPPGHGSSSSKVRYHKFRWTMDLPTNISDPRPGDLKFIGAANGGCSGNGCGYRKVHELRVVNGGKRINIYHENWSHAIGVSFIGKVARYERHSDKQVKNDYEVLSSKPFDVTAPRDFETLRIVGRTRQGKEINLTVERNTHTNVFPLPSGKWGGITFGGVTKLTNQVVYHFYYSE